MLPGFISTPMTEKVPEKVISKVGRTLGSFVSSFIVTQLMALFFLTVAAVALWMLSDEVVGSSWQDG